MEAAEDGVVDSVVDTGEGVEEAMVEKEEAEIEVVEEHSWRQKKGE